MKHQRSKKSKKHRKCPHECGSATKVEKPSSPDQSSAKMRLIEKGIQYQIRVSVPF